MNILLACNAGMSTSLLVQKMRKEAEAEGLDVTIEAKPLNKALESIADCDVLMLGPQIAYAKGEAEKFADGKPVVVIPMSDYGRMNAKAIIDAAVAALKA
jgi:PTS system cellobiose-specific IIB component